MADASRHGTLTGYNGDGCRCEDCREAYREYRRRNADRIKKRMADYYVANKERINARNKAYYEANREDQIAKSVERARRNPEARRAAVRRWRERNPDYNWGKLNPERKKINDRRARQSARGRETYARWCAVNQDKVRAYARDWQKRNPDKAAAARANRRAAMVKARRFTFTARDWARLCARFNHSCAYCGATGKLTIEHVVPLSRGGTHGVGNIVPACEPCNYSKNARLLVEWRLRR